MLHFQLEIPAELHAVIVGAHVQLVAEPGGELLQRALDLLALDHVGVRLARAEQQRLVLGGDPLAVAHGAEKADYLRANTGILLGLFHL